LWRTKQVNDWLNGVWAQVYGEMYSCAINPTLTLREFGRAGGPLMVMAWIGMGLRRKRREIDEAGEGAVGPRLALEGAEEMGEGGEGGVGGGGGGAGVGVGGGGGDGGGVVAWGAEVAKNWFLCARFPRRVFMPG